MGSKASSLQDRAKPGPSTTSYLEVGMACSHQSIARCYGAGRCHLSLRPFGINWVTISEFRHFMSWRTISSSWVKHQLHCLGKSFTYYLTVSLSARFKLLSRGFPSGPAVKTSLSNAGSMGSIPGWETKIPHDSRPKTQNMKQKRYPNEFNKNF